MRNESSILQENEAYNKLTYVVVAEGFGIGDLIRRDSEAGEGKR